MVKEIDGNDRFFRGIIPKFILDDTGFNTFNMLREIKMVAFDDSGEAGFFNMNDDLPTDTVKSSMKFATLQNHLNAAKDSEDKGISIKTLHHLADVVGELDKYLLRYHPSLTLADLIKASR